MSSRRNKIRNRMRIIVPLVLFILCLLIYKIGYYTYRIAYLSYNESRLEQNLENLKEEETYLKNEIVKLQNDEYLARYAREKYKYSKEDELVFSFMDKQNTNNHTFVLDKKILFISIIVSGSLFFIFIVILRKNDKKIPS